MKVELESRIANIPGLEDFFELDLFYGGPIINVPDELVEKILDFGFDNEQLQSVMSGVRAGCTESQVELCFNLNFSRDQILSILFWFESSDDMPVEIMKPYARPDIPACVMGCIPRYILSGLTTEQIEICIRETDYNKREALVSEFIKNITQEQMVERISDIIYISVKEGKYTIEDVKAILRFKNINGVS